MNVENSTWILRLLGKEDENLAALCLFITLLLVCKENCGLRIFFLMPKKFEIENVHFVAHKILPWMELYFLCFCFAQ